MDCTHIWPSSGTPCTGEVIRCDRFPTPDENNLSTWSKLYGERMWNLAKANAGKLICLQCGSVYPLPEEEALEWVWEVCPI